MFARLDFRRFLVCCSGDMSDDESEEKPYVAICGGSICILTGLKYLCKHKNIRLHKTVFFVKLTFRQYPAIHTNCIMSRYTTLHYIHNI